MFVRAGIVLPHTSFCFLTVRALALAGFIRVGANRVSGARPATVRIYTFFLLVHVHTRLCVHACISCVVVHARARLCVHMDVCMRTRTRMLICMYMCMWRVCSCARACAEAFVRARTRARMCACVLCVCVHACAATCAHARAHVSAYRRAHLCVHVLCCIALRARSRTRIVFEAQL
jgi:hypothetical protein